MHIHIRVLHSVKMRLDRSTVRSCSNLLIAFPDAPNQIEEFDAMYFNSFVMNFEGEIKIHMYVYYTHKYLHIHIDVAEKIRYCFSFSIS